MNTNGRLKRWELALALSLCLTLFHGFALGGAGVAWWGVIFPGLTNAPEAVEAAAFEEEDGIELRLWFVDWIEGLFAQS